MSVINATPLLAAAGGDYQIQRSVRLRSSASAYFSRTPATASNRKTWTWSGWVKRGRMGVDQELFSVVETTSQLVGFIRFTASDTIRVFDRQNGGSISWDASSVAVRRDPSAWYHIVVRVDATNATAANRVTIYVNNEQQTLTTVTSPSNVDGAINTALPHNIGNQQSASVFFDGYLAEINFIDGQALTPASFGETDPVTGVWKPKRYAGIYGTNGFFLDFRDPSAATATAIGRDYSGNGNNWTPNNISVTAGSAYDSMLDVPTLWADGANGRGNYCVWSPLDHSGLTFANANLNISTASGRGRASMFLSSGKWYWEVLVQTLPSTTAFGVADFSAKINTANDTQTRGYLSTGSKMSNGIAATYGATFTVGDTIGLALDVDAGTLTFYKNGVSQGVAYSDLAGITWSPFAQGGFACDANFGQRPFAYTPPTGFRALHTGNLPEPSIRRPNQWFDATTYAGNSSTQSVVNAGGFQPDLVWGKNRSHGPGASNWLVDAVRGASVGLSSNLTNAEFTTGGNFVSFNSNGFTVSGTAVEYNASGQSLVGWQWKEGAVPGFDIVTYSGTGAAQNVAHSLGVAPAMMIVKNRTLGTENWQVYHRNMAASPQANQLLLNSTAAVQAATVWNSTAPTSSVFSVSGGSPVGASGSNYVAYLFSEVPGFSRFGSYVGNGSADGPFVFCGFAPAFIILKRTDSTGNWTMYDRARSTRNADTKVLYPNLSNAEDASTDHFDWLSNGFKMKSTNQNTSGGTFVFMAFAETPFKTALAR